MCATYPRGASPAAAIQASRCVLFFGNRNTLISDSNLVPGLREHPTTEQHGPSFNFAIF